MKSLYSLFHCKIISLSGVDVEQREGDPVEILEPGGFDSPQSRKYRLHSSEAIVECL